MRLTRTEENYIKLISRLSHDGQQLVPTTVLAMHLQTSPAAVTDMVQRLHQKELAIYQKYQGVNLAALGKEKAVQILRRQRLWEVFVVRKLQLSWDQAAIVAEELKHVQSDILIEGLDAYLDYPGYSPQGEPIPNAQGHIKTEPQMTLCQLGVGMRGTIVAFKDDSGSFLQYLNKRNIYIGATVKVLEKLSFDHSIDLSIDSGPAVNLSNKVSEQLLVVSC